MMSMLYVVSTPIGNMEDITLRALRILKEADLIAAEDTRKTRVLLKRYGIDKPMVSFFEHNKKQRAPGIINSLKEGRNIALVSSAGTPAVSDPGYYLIKKCAEEKVKMTAVPGASAVINALVLSGMPTDKFYFLGFLPSKGGQKRKRIGESSREKTTLVFFESPRRLIKTLSEMSAVFPDKEGAIVREMTKVYEEVKRGRVKELAQEIKGAVKGECVIVINNR